MKMLLDQIGTQAAAFAEHPLFASMRDGDRSPQARLAFVPYLSYFVMSFADLYRFVLPVHPPGDRFQELVNRHVAEDETHWKWFLADLDNMDLDPQMRFSEALRFVWSDATIRSRMLSYEICKLGFGSSLRKLVLVHAIEATGKIALASFAHPGRQLTGKAQRKLVYFGEHHVRTESEHTIEAAATRELLTSIVLDDASRGELAGVVNDVFRHFTALAQEALEFAAQTAGALAAWPAPATALDQPGR